MPACPDSLLIGLYVLADEFFIDRRGPGRPRKITDAELVCLAVAQVLLDCPGGCEVLATPPACGRACRARLRWPWADASAGGRKSG